MKIRILLATMVLLAASCDCLDFKAGTITVETNCGPTPTSAQVLFAKTPGVITQQQIENYFPGELRALAGDIACQELFDPQSIADLCAPVGAGGPVGEPIEVTNLSDVRVLLCGGQMFAMGGTGDNLYLCEAEEAVIDGQIWFLSCQRFGLTDPSNPTGSCEGVARFEVEAGL